MKTPGLTDSPMLASVDQADVIRRQRAEKIYNSALRCGFLVPAVICEDCQQFGETHGHHDDYEQPLAVRWLCPVCHAKFHATDGRVFSRPKRQPCFVRGGKPTPRQREIFLWIRNQIESYAAPSVREIGVQFGITSPNGVMGNLKALAEKGLIESAWHKARSIRLTIKGSEFERADLV